VLRNNKITKSALYCINKLILYLHNVNHVANDSLCANLFLYTRNIAI